MAHHLALLTALLLVSGSAKAETWDDPECADVAWDFFPCLNFLQGFEPTPSWGCCSQLKDLNKISKQKKGKRRICECIQQMAGDEGELISSHVKALSGKCYVHRSFPISNDMDCAK